MNMEEFQEYLDEKSDFIDKEIERFVQEDEKVENLHEGMIYSLGLDTSDRKIRGRRVRPVLAFCDMCKSRGRGKKMRFLCCVKHPGHRYNYRVGLIIKKPGPN